MRDSMRIKEFIIQNIFMIFVTFVTILFLEIFVFQFYKSTLSGDIADWGSFGDYIGGIVLSLISILLIYKTYQEQKYANIIARFENRFWNLKNGIELRDEELASVNSVSQEIMDHFIRDDHSRKLTNKEFVALLGYYWILHIRDKEVFRSQYFEKIQKLISIVTNNSMVKKQDKESNLSALFIDMIDNEILCLLSHLAFYSYRKCDYSLFSYDAIFNLIIRCDSLCGYVCENNNDKVTCLRLYIENDYGYDEHKRKEESYTQTLNRVIYNKNIQS